MSSSFADSFDGLGGDSLPATGDGYLGGYSDSPIFVEPSPPQIYASGGGLSPELNGDTFSGGFSASMGRDEGVSLREWRRENAIRLEEKERREKEFLSQIVAEAEDYKVDFHSRRKVNCETNKVTNREKEKILVASLEKVHAEADRNYWKTIAELIPNEVAAIEKKREKKGEEKPSIAVVQGPKPGKPTDLSRMRHILLKLKHETPSHLKLPTPVAHTKDAKTDVALSVSAPLKAPPVATPVEAVAVA